MVLGANATRRAIGGLPREGHCVDDHWNTGQIGSSNTSIDKKGLGAKAQETDRVGSQLVTIGCQKQGIKVKIATGKPMEIGLRELNDEWRQEG